MTATKRILTNIFVIAVNFYLLIFFIGLFLMLWTSFAGPVNMWLVIAAFLSALLICVVYQAARPKWDFLTIGEVIIGSTSRNDILEQSTQFTLTRIPVFLLILLTLVLNGNLQDGLSEGQTFDIGLVISLTFLFFSTYYGLKNFFVKAQMLPIFLIAGGLLLVGVGYKFSSKAHLTGNIIFKLETCLAIVWILAGLIYTSKVKPEKHTGVKLILF